MSSSEWYDYQCDPDMDDRMLLFNSLPATHTPLADDHPLQSAVSPLATRGLRDYNRSKTSKATRGLQALHVDAGTATTCVHLRRQPKPSSHRTPPPKTKRPDALACPFSKLDSQRHRSCLTVSFPSVRSVKQHIIIDHHAPISCPICHSTFSSSTDRDRHIVARTCTQRDTPRDFLSGVSEDQVERLMLRDPEVRHAERAADDEERQRQRWFRVWDTVFPGVPRPASAHMTETREREVVALRKYWRKQGRKMVHAALKEEDRADEEVVEALQESVLRKMIDLRGL
ncbi:hypothetical protein B0T18DRAFT_417360 [Schizothecium vesticola]|uniref:C2H2-type domain-containing protein n=1 Tax=Schizothecium vesticola TaxID=314040 RepID=A0AA40EIY3_9PEZI|nr:hypothetical protein B0T18DRAFT_417360 [Schizothecium vesticola]